MSLFVVVGVILFLFWSTQENKLSIVELSLPFILFAAIFFLFAFVTLGRGRLGSVSPSTFRVISSATIVVSIFSLVVLIVFLLLPKHPEEVAGLNPSSMEIVCGIFLNVFIPLWVVFVLGGLVQLLLITNCC